MKLAHRLTLKQLRALVAVADSASFTQAARLLHLTQPAISMQIRDAESIVGQVLVDGRREIHLTPAGEILVRAARQALHSLEMAEVELKARMGVAAGTLDVVAITTAEYFVPHLLAEFGRRHPDISFRLTTSEIRTPAGSVVFRADDVEVPEAWSQVASDVLAQKYFRKAGVAARLKKEIGRAHV